MQFKGKFQKCVAEIFTYFNSYTEYTIFVKNIDTTIPLMFKTLFGMKIGLKLAVIFNFKSMCT